MTFNDNTIFGDHFLLLILSAAKKVPIKGVDNKRQITAVLAVSISGDYSSLSCYTRALPTSVTPITSFLMNEIYITVNTTGATLRQ